MDSTLKLPKYQLDNPSKILVEEQPSCLVHTMGSGVLLETIRVRRVKGDNLETVESGTRFCNMEIHASLSMKRIENDFRVTVDFTVSFLFEPEKDDWLHSVL